MELKNLPFETNAELSLALSAMARAAAEPSGRYRFIKFKSHAVITRHAQPSARADARTRTTALGGETASPVAVSNFLFKTTPELPAALAAMARAAAEPSGRYRLVKRKGYAVVTRHA